MVFAYPQSALGVTFTLIEDVSCVPKLSKDYVNAFATEVAAFPVVIDG